ncbi:cation transporter [Rhodococcus rhodnii]|uniref:Uncharacterized protein n=2 Tax=Rhodococcus rhodnii TaxID=38312 RepID=R7WK17_9NOCA|nr:Na+/H+ antiporter subunit E [Rhodococcus rhodnii]EOM74314.1 hypothetical protein Rrhod_4458 [Rhodococcus rhodnii LMG 5362]TXG89552.1 cation transporter [Rhodococcus rhodnii]
MSALRLLASVLLRIAGFGAVWWALAEGDASMFSYGVVIVPVAVAISLWLVPPTTPAVPLPRRVVALGALGGWFLWQSLLGGIDVARRSIRRPVGVDPHVIEYRIGLTSPAARVALADLNALMPGTLSVDLDGDVLHVHVLGHDIDARGQIARLEQRIARVTGER